MGSEMIYPPKGQQGREPDHVADDLLFPPPHLVRDRKLTATLSSSETSYIMSKDPYHSSSRQHYQHHQLYHGYEGESKHYEGAPYFSHFDPHPDFSPSYYPGYHHHHPSHSHVSPYNYLPQVQTWGPRPPSVVDYIVDVNPQDVLSGRGGATNSHSGNRAFRSLVKKYQDQYLQAKKRDKPAVAAIIVELIRKKGGRFLRRCETPTRDGQVLWIDIGDERAKEKTCQALREGAPELRRKQQASSSDEDDAKRADSHDDQDVDSSPSQIDRTSSEGSQHTSTSQMVSRTVLVKADDTDLDDSEPGGSRLDGPIIIRPWAKLLPQRGPVEPIPLDQLSAEDREIYLRDFLPPCPPIRTRRGLAQVEYSSPEYIVGV